MDVEAVLASIAKDMDKTVKEVRNANIDDIFKKAEDMADWELAPQDKCLKDLFEYVKPQLKSDYSLTIDIDEPEDRLDDTAPTYTYACLVKVITDASIGDRFRKIPHYSPPLDRDKVVIHHKNELRSWLFEVDGSMADLTETEEYFKGMRKISDILSRIKLVYDRMEAYCQKLAQKTPQK